MSVIHPGRREKNLRLEVLILTDPKTDLELILHELRIAGYDPVWQRVATEEDFRQQLAPSLDILIADDDHPQLTGRQAIEILSEMDLVIPVIIISDAVEDMNLDYLAYGAVDYLPKDRMSHLGPAVHRALDESRITKTLVESEKHMRLMIKNAPIGFSGTDLKGNMLTVNPALCQMIGYAENELLGKHFNQITHPDDREINLELYQRLVDQEIEYFDFEKRYMHKNGGIVHVLIRSQLVRNYDGELFFEYALIEDITIRRQMEEEAHHLTLVLRTVRKVNQLIVEEKNRDVLIQTLCQILIENRGYSNAWIMLVNERGEYLDSAEAGLEDQFIPLKKLLIKNIYPRCGIRTLRDKKLSIVEDPIRECRDCPLSGSYEGRGGYSIPLMTGERIFGILTVSLPRLIAANKEEQELFQDIGADIGYALQKLETEEHSEKSEKALSEAIKIINRSPAVAFLWKNEENWPVEFVSENVENIFGYTSQEFRQGDVSYAQIIHPDDLARVNVEVESLSKNNKELTITHQPYRVIAKGGNIRWIEDATHIRIDSRGNTTHFEGIIHDITDRVQAEDRSRQRTKDLSLINAINTAINLGQELPDILELLTNETKRVFKSNSTTVYLCSENHKFLEMQNLAISPKTKKRIEKLIGISFPKIRVPIKEGSLTHEFLQADGPTISSDPETIQKWMLEFAQCTTIPKKMRPVIRKLIPQIYKLVGVQSMITVPMISAGETIGLMDFSRQVPFTEEESIRVAGVVGQVTAAITSLRGEKKILQQLNRLDALRIIDQAIIGSLDLNVTLNIILEQLLTQLEVDAVAVQVYEADLQTLQFAHGRGFQTDALQHTGLRLGEGYAGKVALKRDHVFIPDLVQDGGKIYEFPQFREKEKFVAYYGVPLIAKGTLVGVLEIFHRSALEPGVEWVNFLQSLASQVAIAIENTTMFIDLQRSNVDLTQAYDATIEGWAHALELKDMETEGHSRRVVNITMDMAKRMGISGEKLVHIRRGALLHDIGKMGIPDAILQKPGKLSDEEWQVMRQHPVYTLDWLYPIEYLRPALEIPYSHHEKWDGTGYPRGIKEELIPLSARIFAIVDVWDALTADRPYRKAWSKEKTLDHIRKESGKHFDPQVVKVFLDMIKG